MDKQIELHIVEFSNGVKVINLLPNEIYFDDPNGQIMMVPRTEKDLKITTMKKRLDPDNSDAWRVRIDPPPQEKIRLLKATSLPHVGDMEWIIRNVPNDVLVVTGRARAEVYGFPCVTPMVSFIEDRPIHRIDCFMWGDTGILTDTGIPLSE